MKKTLLFAGVLGTAFTVHSIKAPALVTKTVPTQPETVCPSAPAKQEKMTKHTLPSGLSYEIIQEAKNPQTQTPYKGARVTVHYTGWLNENGKAGKKFDSSVDRNDPLVFPLGVGYVIKGWDEGVMSMKVGEKRRLYIPSALGYGARGAGNAIPPHADLIFDVELISVA